MHQAPREMLSFVHHTYLFIVHLLCPVPGEVIHSFVHSLIQNVGIQHLLCAGHRSSPRHTQEPNRHIHILVKPTAGKTDNERK